MVGSRNLVAVNLDPLWAEMDYTKVKRITVSTLTVATIMFGATVANAQDQDLNKIISEVDRTTAMARTSQDKIDGLSDQAAKLFGDYRTLLQTNEGLRAYNNQLNKAIKIQITRIADIEKAITGISAIKRQVTPLMLEMMTSLEEFVAMDVPFEKEAREERLAGLRTAMDDPQVSEPERFRLILTEYKNEVSYGNSVNAWEGTLADDRSVNFVRIGRVGYYYQTKDRSETAAWNESTNAWEVLGAEHSRPVNRMIKMANKILPMDVVVVPVGAPKE